MTLHMCGEELYLPHMVVHTFFERYAQNDAAINQICFKAETFRDFLFFFLSFI